MTAQENERFFRSIRKYCDQYYEILGHVNAETSDCSRVEDRESIREGIKRSVGFGKLNRMVFGVMEQWMEEQLRLQAKLSTKAGDETGAMMWHGVLATALQKQGRLDEAAVVFEAILKYQRGALPENHPNIGAT